MYENESHKKQSDEKLVVYVDIDETICFYNDNQRVYKNAIPNLDNIKKINCFFDKGYKIIYYTSRGSSDKKNKERRKYIKDLTKKQLKEWGAKYNRLSLDKPFFDIIIDDKSLRIEEINDPD